MTCIIKLLNNTPKSICKLGLKKSGMSIIIKKTFGRDISALDVKCPSKISFELDINTQISTNHHNQCT